MKIELPKNEKVVPLLNSCNKYLFNWERLIEKNKQLFTLPSVLKKGKPSTSTAQKNDPLNPTKAKEKMQLLLRFSCH